MVCCKLFFRHLLASLPLEVHRRTETGHEMVRDAVGAWLDRAVNPTLSSSAWRKYIFEQVLTGGRSVTLIVRNGAGVVTDLVPLDTANMHVLRRTRTVLPGVAFAQEQKFILQKRLSI